MTELEEKFQRLITHIEEAGEIARAYFDSDDASNDIKVDGSVVTRVDMEIERKLSAFIREEFPDDSIVGEEGEGYQGTSSFEWHIDPIDGTDNFLREIPFIAISVARLGDQAEDTFSVVHNPITKRSFFSYMENGVYENSRAHVVTEDVLGGRAVVSLATGKSHWVKTAKYNLMKEFGMKLGRGTALNCAALELGYLAANRIDGVLILGLKSYDYAAGLYLVKAAGGTIHFFRDGRWNLHEGFIKNLCNLDYEIILASHRGMDGKILDMVGDPKKWADAE